MKLARGNNSEWILLGATLLVSSLLLGFGRGVGDSDVEAEVTLVPADAVGLSCAGEGCAFDASGAAVAMPMPLRPFVTTGGQLIAMSGVFESEPVKAWVANAQDPRARAKVRCEAKWISHRAKLSVRFRAEDAFGAPAEVPALAARECQLVP